MLPHTKPKEMSRRKQNNKIEKILTKKLMYRKERKENNKFKLKRIF